MVHITVDGLSGTGKTTVCKRLSRKLGILYVDPNTIVNVISLKCIQKSVNPTSENDVGKLLEQTKIELEHTPMGVVVKVMPGFFEMIDGRLNIGMMKEVSIEDLLERDSVKLDHDGISDYLEHQVVMVSNR